MNNRGSRDSTESSHRDCGEYQRLWQRKMSRRDMLKGTMGAMAMGAGGSHVLLNGRILEQLGTIHPGAAPADSILIVIQQGGGNDGLNTVIPYTSDLYYQRRPTLAVPANQVLHLDANAGLHPNMTGIKGIWDAGHAAVLQGVGYAGADMSHFESVIAWETGDPTGASRSGWLGRYLDTALGANTNPLKALSIGWSLPLAFSSLTSSTPALTALSDFQLWTDSGWTLRTNTLDAFRAMNGKGEKQPTYAAIRSAQATTLSAVDDLQAVPAQYQALATYPQTDLATQLQLVAQLINANVGTRVFWVEQDGYDDHSHEAGDHAQLLSELDGAVSAFYADMKAHGWDGKVLIMTWSEFGRRVEENGDQGTDHGTAAPMLIIGGGVTGGVYGDDPVLSNLDTNGNLNFGIDYRSVYRTIVERWLGADSKPVVGTGFELIPFV